MKFIMVVVMLFSSGAIAAHDQVQKQVLNSPAMAMTCEEQVEYNQDMVNKYMSKSDLTPAEQAKLDFFLQELNSWSSYCAKSTRSIEATEDEQAAEVPAGTDGNN